MAYAKSEAALLITAVLLGERKNAASPAETLPSHRANSTTHSSSRLPWPVTTTLQPSKFWSTVSAGSSLGHAKNKDGEVGFQGMDPISFHHSFT